MNLQTNAWVNAIYCSVNKVTCLFITFHFIRLVLKSCVCESEADIWTKFIALQSVWPTLSHLLLFSCPPSRMTVTFGQTHCGRPSLHVRRRLFNSLKSTFSFYPQHMLACEEDQYFHLCRCDRSWKQVSFDSESSNSLIVNSFDDACHFQTDLNSTWITFF